MSEERKPWAFVAYKGSKFGGVISPELSKREVRKFIVDMVTAQYTMKTVYDRAEYEAFLASLKE